MMEIVIKIPEEKYNYVKKQVAEGIDNPLKVYIANGTPLTEKTDAISRAEVLDLIDSKDPNYEVRHFKEDVECLDSVSTEKTGRWEWVQYDFDPNLGNWHCSECRNILVYAVKKDDVGGIPIAKYCPNCGAKMVVDESVDELVDECKREKLGAEE